MNGFERFSFFKKSFLDGLVDESSLSLLIVFLFFFCGLVGPPLLIWRAGHSTWSNFFSLCTSICAFSPSCIGRRRPLRFCVLPYVLITFICIAFYGWCFAFAPFLSCRVRSCIHRLPASCTARLRPRRPSARRMRLYSISNYAQRFLLFVSKYTHTCFLLTYRRGRCAVTYSK